MSDGSLAGRRVLVARARPGRSAIAAELRAAGADVLEVPAIEVVDVSGVDIAASIAGREVDAIVFACAAGVDAALGTDGSGRFARPILAVGAEAAAALDRRGIEPEVRIRGTCRDALAEAAGRIAGRRLLLVTSESGRPGLAADLVALGARVEGVAAYRVVQRMPEEALPPIDLVVLPSSSAARAV